VRSVFPIFIRILDCSVGMEVLYDLGLGGASTRFGEKVLFYPKLFCESRCKLLYICSFESIFHFGRHTWIYLYRHNYFQPPLALKSLQCQCSVRFTVV